LSPGVHVTRAAPGPWPLAFECGREWLTGWWHAPYGPEQRIPVVLCAPRGWEGEATYRTFVRWGEILSRAGFPVLRFDYAGSGDSPGSDEDPGRLVAWLSSVHAAVVQACRIAGSTRVALCGIHLGATLAARAAAERSDVQALVAWGPFATGRAYVRQVRAYRLLNALPSDPRGEATHDEEAAGYRLTRATASELEELDLRALPRAPSPLVLLLSREGHPDRTLATAWTERGADVTTRPGPGWEEMMQQPLKSVVPESVLEDSVRFLSDVARAIPAAPRVPAAPERWQRGWAVGTEVVEEALCLGPDGRVAGVLGRPTQEGWETLPTVLFLTTDLHHRIGPARLWVRLGRVLSRLGLQTLRFDLAGVGDSLLLPGQSPPHTSGTETVSEVREVMDVLERATGARRFILVGLCSGAYLAYHSAVADPRVAGMVALNLPTLRWKEGDSLDVRQRQTLKSARYYRKALLQGETWRRALKGELHLRQLGQVLLARGWRRLRERTMGGLRRNVPQAGQALETLVQRGTDLYFLFAADDEGVDALEREAGPLLRRLSRSGSLQVEVVEGPSHTFEQLWAQELVADRVLERLSTTLGLGHGRASRKGEPDGSARPELRGRARGVQWHGPEDTKPRQ
jgi:pimeloyl-ACP methyl ester carboxylesterase